MALAVAGAAPFQNIGAAQTVATPVGTPRSSEHLSDSLLTAFASDIEAALETFQVPGAAVTLVQGTEVAFLRGFGVRDLVTSAPVTPQTRFRIGSVTKSVTTLFLATLVDDGVLAWDDRVVDLWPAFRGPTPELTGSLRLRDLLGMGSGIAESEDLPLPVVEFFMMAGQTSAQDVLRGLLDLPVIGLPGTTYSYNNTLVAAAAFIGLLAAGAAEEDGLEPAYARATEDRVFGPLGMANAAIAEDPRPLGDDYAVGYTHDLFGTPSALPFVPLAGIAPAGSGLAGIEDLARYLIALMNGGISAEGTRVVSAANLAELFRPGIAMDTAAMLPPEFMPDTVSLHYGMGWVIEAFRDGRQLVWHSGGIDGFATLVGFFPAEKIGFAVVANEDRAGGPFNLYVRASLLGRLFGLEADLPAFLAEAWPQFAAQTAELAATTQLVDPDAVQSYLGLYEDGFQLRLDGGDLILEQGLHVLPLLALPDGNYIIADGPDVAQEARVAFAPDADGVPVMTITGFAPVRWLTGS
jgi:CubicO group peptidase (beta-lactamase class C family)